MTDVLVHETEVVTVDKRGLPSWAGVGTVVALAVVGFGLIGYTWFQVSDLTEVAKQLPYFVSGGLTGLGLVVLSAALLVVVTRGKDERERNEQAEALVEALRALGKES